MPNFIFHPSISAEARALVAAAPDCELTLEESKQVGTSEPLCSVGHDGKVWVNPRVKKIRRRAIGKAQRRPLVRHSAPRHVGRPVRVRAPRRRRTAGTRASESRAGPGSDGDPPAPLAAAVVSKFSDAERGSRRHGGTMLGVLASGFIDLRCCSICGFAHCTTLTFCQVSRELDALRVAKCWGSA